MFELQGRIALATGAGQNQGEGIARALAGQGAAVAVNDLVPERAERVAAAIEAGGGRALTVPCDVTDGAAVRAAVARVGEALGPPDVLVNNAGVPEGMAVAPFRETHERDWRPYVELNLYGVLHCTRAVIDPMCERGFGRVVTISSGAGQTGIAMGVSAYGAGKGGAIAFMRHLAMEVARHGITANTLALGLMANTAGSGDTAALERTIPLGRLGLPADVGAACVYLASDEAGWMTGQTIGLNGGNLTS